MKRITSCIIFWAWVGIMHAQDRLTGESFTVRSEILAQNGMAATSQPFVTQVTLDILKRGRIDVDNKAYSSTSESRKDGQAAGY